MKTLLNPGLELLEKNPEVKSFIYQQISEFDQFVTPETVVTVVSRDPKKLALQYETEGKEFTKQQLSKLYRIAILLTEGKTKLEAEGINENIFEAVRMAKDSLMQKMLLIQDSVVSHQDRLIEINHYLQNRGLH
jgi:hypothetical protein